MTTINPTGIALDVRNAPAPPARNWWRTGLVIFCWLVFIAAMVLAYIETEIRPLDLWSDRANMATQVREYFPDTIFSWSSWIAYFSDWRMIADKMLETVYIALWGSVLAVVCAIPLGLLSAHNVAPWWIRHPVRRAMDACRAINELVFALMFVAAVGLGPMAGILALWIHTMGTLAKLFSEAVEAIDPRPVEGIRATGANRVEETLFGVIPQVVPLWISFSLYRFEANVRSATVLGIVGAGGIGQPLHESIRAFHLNDAGAILIIIIVAVVVLDIISAQVRRLYT